MKTHTHRNGGITFISHWGLSLNEGRFPNIHLRWGRRPYGFYIALTHRWKFWWFTK